MKTHERLLLQNKAWSKARQQSDKDFFSRLAQKQTPGFLWIGCSDSRVPADQITGTQPGEIFVHRNIANMVVHTDFNMLSVLQYAVEVLKIEDIIVCGHYGCGGVKAAMTHNEMGLINKWLRHIKDVYRFHQDELEAEPDEEKRTNMLVEYNIKEQVLNLAKTSIIQKAWQKHKGPTLHGWVYGLSKGLLSEICLMEPGAPIDPIYQFDLSDKTV